MALTPEDVVNKRFQPTKFREGYDQDEVDDFLDEVVVELRRLNQENEELRQRLIASDSQASASFSAPTAQPAPAGIRPAGYGVRSRAPVPGASAAVASVSPRSQATVSEPDHRPDRIPTTCFSWLAACTRSTFVRVSRSVMRSSPRVTLRLQRVIDEANSQAGRALEEANDSGWPRPGRCQRSRPLASSKRPTLRHATASLRSSRSALRSRARIEELRNFEREYRSKLKGYIEGQLRELDTSSAVLTSAAAPVSLTEGAISAPEGANSAPEARVRWRGPGTELHGVTACSAAGRLPGLCRQLIRARRPVLRDSAFEFSLYWPSSR